MVNSQIPTCRPPSSFLLTIYKCIFNISKPTYYKDGYINTVFNRHIEVDPRRAFNYLIQSTTADLVLERAVAIDSMLEGKKSFISHIVHDDIVIDFADEDRDMVVDIRDTFAKNRLGDFVVNLSAGKDYYDLNRMSI